MSNRSKWIYSTVFSAGLLLAGFGISQTFTYSVNKNVEENNDANYRNHIQENYKIFSLATPEGLDFAGEKVPLDDIDIRERLDKELVINTYWHSQTLFMLKRSNRWFPVMEKILKEEGVPIDFKYLAAIESNFDNVVSPAGAAGYWQFLKSTGANYGLEVNAYVDERYHVEKATKAACSYLKDAYKNLGSWTLVAASYNMGVGGVQSKINEQGTKNYYDMYLNSETHRYVFRVLAAKEILSHPEFYGFNVRPKDYYAPYETRIVKVSTPITNLNDFAIENGTTLKVLKLLNPWLRSSSLPNKTGKEYEILFPQENFPLGTTNP